jgi:hypothetical protein
MNFGVKKILLIGFLTVLSNQFAYAGKRIVTDRKPLGKGLVYSWVEYGIRPRVQAIGISITGSAMDSLPEDMQVIVLKPKKQHSVPPFKHFTVDWNPHGHDPMGIYTVPHFDYHFFMISSAKRESITCANADAAVCMVQPNQALIPANYVPTPEGVPMMGWHWVDITSPEFNGQPFSATMIYGYYNGKINFIEPMVALSYLETQPNAEFEIKQPAEVSAHGYYPKRYHVWFKAATDTYEVVMTDFVWR